VCNASLFCTVSRPPVCEALKNLPLACSVACVEVVFGRTGGGADAHGVKLLHVRKNDGSAPRRFVYVPAPTVFDTTGPASAEPEARYANEIR